MLEVIASARGMNDRVLEKLEFISKKVILLLNYNLLINFRSDIFSFL